MPAAYRLGFIVDFLSKPTLTGFMGGAAVIVSLQQLKGLLGIVHFTTKMGIIPVMQSVLENRTEVRTRILRWAREEEEKIKKLNESSLKCIILDMAEFSGEATWLASRPKVEDAHLLASTAPFASFTTSSRASVYNREPFSQKLSLKQEDSDVAEEAVVDWTTRPSYYALSGRCDCGLCCACYGPNEVRGRMSIYGRSQQWPLTFAKVSEQERHERRNKKKKKNGFKVERLKPIKSDAVMEFLSSSQVLELDSNCFA
ncbi:hypothetical protein BHE74_00019416 [Ensete ventricosum]|nr:hypothetical protein BHE74_00019416 [Ensete ventricosum]